ncbi:MAG: DUF3073 domain-containing protein [Microbacteriaceae bacterium]|jgi:hypothetical protein|nr:MAG: hypothetical protein ABR66_04665 [Microbacteriaceae bacterium BACL25 MAG-120322-bin65]HAA78831.1 DUF3073 domain-containing protein [Microbacteriaceae bacterium]
MGRGRQKAKNTKVARELKYYSPNTDLSQLQKELASSATPADSASSSEDAWADYNDAEEESA